MFTTNSFLIIIGILDFLIALGDFILKLLDLLYKIKSKSIKNRNNAHSMG